MKTDDALVSVKDNRDCDINITVGETDELSPLSIYKGKTDISDLEDAFSDRVGLSCTVLNNNVLPKQLRNDFEIKPRISRDKIEFYTKAKTDDAYQKYPIKMNFSMQFPNIEEAHKFKNGGFDKLQEEANRTGKPVKIPYIKSIKEFLGEFENPTSYVNKHGWEGSELYIMPRPIPPSQEYCIDIFNSFTSFSLNTRLRLTETLDDGIILSNSENIDEPFDVKLKICNIDKDELSEDMVNGKISISIYLKEKHKRDCKYNLELIKFRFLADDKNNTIIIKNSTLDKEVFRFDNCGTTLYKKKDCTFCNKIIDLIQKVIYISKIKGIDIEYDLNYFLKNEDNINLLFNEINNSNYINRKKSYWTITSDSIDEEKIRKENGKLSVLTKFSDFKLFGQSFVLKEHRVILKNCKILEVQNKQDVKEIKLEVKNLIFEIL